jgi:hypothetical protein
MGNKEETNYQYQNELEKFEKFEIINIKSLTDLDEVKKIYTNGNFVFRGMNNWKYKMYTSFQREIIFDKLKYASVTSLYKSNFMDLLSKTHVTKIQYEEEELLHKVWFDLHLKVNSFMQHYQMPTPMLDFSSDFDISLYFAFWKLDSKEVDYVSIVLLDTMTLSNEDKFIEELCFFKGSTYKNPTSYFDLLVNDNFEKERVYGFSNHITESIYRTKSEHVLFKPSKSLINDRIEAQKGMFLFF